MDTINEKSTIITYENYDLTIKNDSLYTYETTLYETKPVAINFLNNCIRFIKSYFINKKEENKKEENIKEILSNTHFKKWLQKCYKSKINISKIKIDAIIRFGPRIGFICASSDANVNIYNKRENKNENKKIPGTIFIRGNSVCCLLIIKIVGQNKYHMVLVKQFRVPIGQQILETPAGMMDDEHNIVSAMITEIKEETEIIINNKNLIESTDIKEKECPIDTLIHFGGFYPSPGGCDEYIDIFAYMIEMTQSKIVELNGKLINNPDSKELITIQIESLNWQEIDKTNDSKLLIAASKFERKFPNIII